MTKKLGKIQKHIPDNTEIKISSETKLFLKKNNLKIDNNITKSNAEVISSWVTQENSIQKHMLAKSPYHIYINANNYGCVKISYGNDIVGFVCLYKYEQIYEAGTLIVHLDFRSMGLGKILQKTLFHTYKQHAIFLVTSIDKVMKISEKTELIGITRDEMSDYVLELIERGGKLMSNDSVYVNKGLLLNKKLNNLNKKQLGKLQNMEEGFPYKILG